MGVGEVGLDVGGWVGLVGGVEVESELSSGSKVLCALPCELDEVS